MVKEKEQKKQEVLPVNRQVKDTFFKTVYQSKERLQELAVFLLGVPKGEVKLSNVRPVMFGNRENDVAFLCNGVIYCMMEEESSVCPNMPYRQLEYVTAGLRSMVDSALVLYSSQKVYFPLPKLYMVQAGIEERRLDLFAIQYDMRLSDSYKKWEGQEEIEPDLEAVVHVYDFRMTPEEILSYIEQQILPERFSSYAGDLLNYALTACSLTYIQRTGNAKDDEKPGRYVVPKNAETAQDVIKLLMERGIFVDLLAKKEVCDMTMATFSREDIILYRGMERGEERGDIKRLIKMVLKKLHKGKTVAVIADELEEEPEVIERICLAIEACAPREDVEVIYRKLEEQDNKL